MAKRKATNEAEQLDVTPREAAAGTNNQAAHAQPQPAEGAPTHERQPGDEPEDQAKRPYQSVRGWTQRFTGPLKYRKLTDDNMKIIAFKFHVAGNDKLPDEVLAVMRDNKTDKDGNATGLKFMDTRKHGKIWMIPNDLEGRILADKIDFKLSQLAQKMEETQGPPPF